MGDVAGGQMIGGLNTTGGVQHLFRLNETVF